MGEGLALQPSLTKLNPAISRLSDSSRPHCLAARGKGQSTNQRWTPIKQSVSLPRPAGEVLRSENKPDGGDRDVPDGESGCGVYAASRRASHAKVWNIPAVVNMVWASHWPQPILRDLPYTRGPNERPEDSEGYRGGRWGPAKAE